MSKCKNCDKEFDSLPFKCKFCKDLFCLNCRLPEKHNCAGLKNYNENKSKIYFKDKLGSLTKSEDKRREWLIYNDPSKNKHKKKKNKKWFFRK